MDKGDIWLPQKLGPMSGKIPVPRQTPLTTGGLLTPGHKLTIPVTRNVATSWFRLPGKKDFLFCHILREWSVIFRLIIEKENKL